MYGTCIATAKLKQLQEHLYRTWQEYTGNLSAKSYIHPSCLSQPNMAAEQLQFAVTFHYVCGKLLASNCGK